MSTVAKIRLSAAGAVLAALTIWLHTGWGDPAWWALPALTVLVAAGEIAVVYLSFGRQRWAFSCTDGILAAALILAPGAWMVPAVAGGVVVAQLYRRRPRLKVVYNVAQFVLAAAAGAWTARYLGGDVAAACAGAAVFWVINHSLVALAVSLTSHRRLLPLLGTGAPLSAIHTAGNSSIGLLAAWLATTAPLGLLGLIVPLALLWSSYDQQTRRAAEARLFAELARGQERAAGRSTDLSAQVVLTAAARLFGGADVEMMLVTPEGVARYVGDETGAGERHLVDPNAFHRPWVLRALGAGGVTTGVEAGRPYCSAVLIGPTGTPLAVLQARKPMGTAGFGRREAMLARVLVGQAESWLSVADLSCRHDAAVDQARAVEEAARALGDLGAHAAPALAVLRASAARLARLADGLDSPDRVTGIVDELCSVERAVASLLGAVALHAEPGLPSAPVPPGRPATDWTSSGVLQAVEAA